MFIKFQTIEDGATREDGKQAIFEIIAYSENYNRNGYYFDIDDLLRKPEVPVRKMHGEESQGNPPQNNVEVGDIYPSTVFADMEKLEDANLGQYVQGVVYSDNEDFLQDGKNITNFSIEGYPNRRADVFSNRDKELVVRPGGFDFTAIAALFGEGAGSGGARILRKMAFSMLDPGHESEPDNSGSQIKKLKNNMDENQIKEIVQNTVQEEFSKREQASKITFSINKNVSKDEQKRQLEEQADKLGFAIVDKTEDEKTEENARKAVESKGESKEASKATFGSRNEASKRVNFEDLNI